MSTSGGRPRRRPRVALGRFRGDVRRGRARVAPARRAVPSGRPVDVVVRPERHGTPRSDAEARSPRSRERLARAKAEAAALAARVRGHDPSAISGGVSFAPSDPRVIAAPLDASGARVYDRDRLGSHGTFDRAAATAGGSSTPTPSSCARRSRATRRSCGVRTSSGTDRRARRTPSSPSAEPTTVQEPRVFFATRTSRQVRRARARRRALFAATHVRALLRVLGATGGQTRARCGGVPRAVRRSRWVRPSQMLLCDEGSGADALTRDASAAPTARAAKVVDVCFLCAPDWKETRALEDTRRDQIAGLEARHATPMRSPAGRSPSSRSRRANGVESRAEQKANARVSENGDRGVRGNVRRACAYARGAFTGRTRGCHRFRGTSGRYRARGRRGVRRRDRRVPHRRLLQRRARRRRKRARRGRLRGFDGQMRADEGPTPWPPTPWPPPTPTRTAPRPHGTSPIRRMISLLAARARLPRSWRRFPARGDDVDAGDARHARRPGRGDGGNAALRTIGDADEAAARAAERDRARLDEVMRRDGGAYPLRRSVRYSTTDDARVDGGRVSASGAARRADRKRTGPNEFSRKFKFFPTFTTRRRSARRRCARRRRTATPSPSPSPRRRRPRGSRKRLRDAKRGRRRRRARETRALNAANSKSGPPSAWT